MKIQDTPYIRLTDGTMVTPAQHFALICAQYGLSGLRSIRRDPADPERWIEFGSEPQPVEVPDVQYDPIRS